MNKRISLLNRSLAGIATLAIAGLPLFASASPHSRVHRQHQRIDQGEKSGQLTNFEAQRDTTRLDAINAQRKAWLNAQGGKLTDAQKNELHSELNNSSRAILFTKHNENNKPGAPDARTVPLPKVGAQGSPGYLGDRLQRQFDRLHNGVSDGTLTRAEYNAQSKQLQAIAAQRDAWMKANGGSLTQAQQSQIQSELDANSKSLLNDKHNQQGQPG